MLYTNIQTLRSRKGTYLKPIKKDLGKRRGRAWMLSIGCKQGRGRGAQQTHEEQRELVFCGFVKRVQGTEG